MIRTFLSTTALATMIATSALSAGTAPPAGSVPVFSKEARQDAPVIKDGYLVSDTGAVLASSLIGATVYNGTGDDAAAIGDVNDIVIGLDGTAEALIVGVGGFLGIGEKNVAVDLSRVSWVDHDGERWIVVDASKEQLEAAPAYARIVAPTKPESDMTKTSSAPAKASQPASSEAGHDAAPIDRASLPKVDISTMKASDLDGARVYGGDDRDLGEISDVIVTDTGSVEAFVVDVGGFLGIGEKPVAIGAENIDFMRNSDGDLIVVTPFTQEQLEKQPTYSEGTYRADPQNGVLRAPKS